MPLAILATASPADAVDSCPNEALRTGASRGLPDCRAYELVTPADANGLNPTAINIGNSTLGVTDGGFDTLLAAASGNSVIFETTSGSLPGFEGNGVFDQYQAVREPQGWATRFVAPTGAQSFGPHPGGVSPDHLFSFWKTSGFPYDRGSLQVDEGNGDGYVRVPSGAFEPIGLGSQGTDFQALGKWITVGGSHVIFTSKAQLEPEAPSAGTEAVYDRAIGGDTQVVSLLPGNITPSEDAIYQGGSSDATTQVFKLGKTLYERRGNLKTAAIASEDSAPVGSTFSCNGSPSEGVTLEYQWLRNAAPILGATSSSYTATAADAGSALQCQVLVKIPNTGATQTSAPAIVIAPFNGTAPPAPPANLPNVTPANPIVGTTVTCTSGTWSGSPTFTYQWYKDAIPIPGATNPTYEVQAADVPSSLQCAVTGTNLGGAVVKLTRNRPTSPAPSPAAPTAGAEVPFDPAIGFAGASADGGKVFYEQLGTISSFDTETESSATIASGGDARIVLVSPDGTRVYFVSTLQLVGGEGTPGSENFYVWDRGTVRYIATLSPSDFISFGGLESVNLGKWRNAIGPLQNVESGPASVPARSTADGSVLAFQSHASLTSYDSEGHSEIYRYDLADQSLSCVSCNPLGQPPSSDAELQSIARGAPTSALSHISNLSADGETIFFQSGDALAGNDVDGAQDVYTWKSGQVSLISSGHSGGPDYLYGVTPSGSDVFFVTFDVLSSRDLNGNNQKIYDARVNGGFAEPPKSPPPCEGDACQGQVSLPPVLPAPASAGFLGPSDPQPRRVRHRRKHHKKKHVRRHHQKHRHRASGKRGGAR